MNLPRSTRRSSPPSPPPPLLPPPDENPASSPAGVEQGDGQKGSRVVEGIVRRDKRAAALRRVALGIRASAAALSLVSFSIMASDRTEGWTGDSFDRYPEYQYCLTINVIVFAYLGFQIYMELHHAVMKREIICQPFRYYFDFSMDQILAYLLISASSSAATRNNDWVTSWGSDEFTNRISGSLAMSFLAFVALAFSSIISAHNLFSKDL